MWLEDNLLYSLWEELRLNIDGEILEILRKECIYKKLSLKEYVLISDKDIEFND